LRICVTQGTTTIQRLKEFFPERYIVESSSPSLTIEKFVKEDCNAIAGGFIDVTLANIQSFGYDGPYEIGPTAFSKEPLALVTREEDPLWSAFCYWVVSATLYAEERGITQQTYSKMPRVDLFGPMYQEMFRNSIQAMGSYAEIYERTAGAKGLPREGPNLLNKIPMGPQLYSLLLWDTKSL
jgi:hypothetical protein